MRIGTKFDTTILNARKNTAKKVSYQAQSREGKCQTDIDIDKQKAVFRKFVNKSTNGGSLPITKYPHISFFL